MNNLLTMTENIIRSNGLIEVGDYLIVGVSGGPDSMALLTVLESLKSDFGFDMAAAHLHHGLREDADHDEALVSQWCHEHSIPLFIKKVNLKTEAKHLAMSLEETGRVLRRDFFEQCRTDVAKLTAGNILIALAHHRQDQAETMIFNLSRGSGLSGLAGMRMFDYPYIRPFLNMETALIHDWLKQQNIPWRRDHTNSETVYTRNRIRHILIPCWQDTIGFNPVPSIVRACDSLAVDEDYLTEIAEAAFELVYDPSGFISRQLLNQYHEAVRVRVLRLFFYKCAGTVRNLGQKHLELMRISALNGSGPYDLPHGIRVRSFQDRLLLEIRGNLNDDNEAADWQTELNSEGLTTLPHGLGKIEAVKIEYNSDFRYNSLMNCFRKDCLQACVVRNRRPGDRIKPAGRPVNRKLKKFMNEEKIDPQLRNTIPLIAKGNDIVWVPDHSCGDEYICRPENMDFEAVRLIWHR